MKCEEGFRMGRRMAWGVCVCMRVCVHLHICHREGQWESHWFFSALELCLLFLDKPQMREALITSMCIYNRGAIRPSPLCFRDALVLISFEHSSHLVPTISLKTVWEAVYCALFFSRYGKTTLLYYVHADPTTHAKRH